MEVFNPKPKPQTLNPKPYTTNRLQEPQILLYCYPQQVHGHKTLFHSSTYSFLYSYPEQVHDGPHKIMTIFDINFCFPEYRSGENWEPDRAPEFVAVSDMVCVYVCMCVCVYVC
jgi:hypothetical protein